ncbi:TetR/AcrR family transcriptional regulator [Actinomadura fibrosa]|uniref:TetR/AcrR family transcriptional regulator n=1 Tax=Actinomadura fibrosa TaxID=111802 RepID=A0ABW2XX21_9ACTN
MEDLTARARIRNAALEQFATHGLKGTTIRGVAEAAGVSPGLVQHHFGSKQKLREVCDEHVMREIRRIKMDALDTGTGDPGYLSAVVRASVPIRRYLARTLVEGSPAAAKLFDESVEFTKEMLEAPPPGLSKPATTDLDAYAAAMTSIAFGVVALHEHLSRALGEDTLSAEGYPRLAKALMEIFTDNIMDPDLVGRNKEALDRMEGGGRA